MRWDIDKLGVFHANQTSMCLYPHLNYGWGWWPLNQFKPSCKIFLLTVSRRCFFCGSFMLFLSCFVVLSCTSVCWCIVVSCWERADLLALFCDVFLWRCHFSIGILGQVWCLIVSIPDLCPLSYLVTLHNNVRYYVTKTAKSWCFQA